MTDSEWGAWGTIGDTFGGLANVGSFLVVCFGLWYALGELARNRAQHRAELRADAAIRIWRSAFRFASALTHVIGPIRAKLAQPFDPASRSYFVIPQNRRGLLLERIEDASFEFQDATADAAMLFDSAQTAPLDDLWAQHEATLSWVEAIKPDLVWGELESKWAAEFAAASERTAAIELSLQKLKESLAPFARLH